MQIINVVKNHRIKLRILFEKDNFLFLISSNMSCKLVLIGDAAVGKSSLARRYNIEEKKRFIE